MRRRDFLHAVGGITVSWPWSSASAEPYRTLGVLLAMSEDDPVMVGNVKALRQALAELGWREGENLKIELRLSSDEVARTRAYAKELIDLRPDVILASGPAFPPLRDSTRTIPIVFVLISDPVGQGFVSSLAHPGGNLTGFMLLEFSAGTKFVEMLKAVAPATKRVAILEDPANTTTPQWWRSIEGAARDVGIEPQQALVRSEGDIDAAIDAIARTPNGSIIVAPQALFYVYVHRTHLIASAARERLPAIYSNANYVREGGLLSYGINGADQFAQAATYIDRIFKGAKPGNLPVQGPTKFQLAINLKTAKALGLTVAPTLLATADELIE
jgi:putative tryptophan/tyrosine transport system substrate-binding protein